MRWDELSEEEQNVLIAEKVMGLNVEYWTEEDYENTRDPSFCYVTGYVVIHPPTAFLYWSRVSHYTESMDAAWDIIELFKREGRNNADLIHFLYHLESLAKYRTPRDLLYDLTPTLICKAALITLELVDEHGNIKEEEEV